LKRFEHELLNGLSAWHSELVLLQTIPGIDIMDAAMLLVEISAQMEGFGSAERLASWVIICPGNNESAGKRKTGKIRNGNA
jgi:transposase